MPSAVCPHCKESAFSSVEFNRVWTCPYCGKQVVPESEPVHRSAHRDAAVDYYSRFWTVQE